MYSLKANLVNKLIVLNNQNFSLKGMICPTFQNEGTCDVIIQGRILKPNSSFGVYAPGYALQNSVNIQFVGSPSDTKRLYLSYLEEVI